MVLCLLLHTYASYTLIVFKVANLLLASCLIHQRYYYFYHSIKEVFIFTIVQEASYVWLSFVVAILNFMNRDISIFTFVYTTLTLVIFDCMALLIFLQKTSLYYLTSFPSIKAEAPFEQYFLSLKQYFNQNDSQSINKNILLGLLKYHFQDCNVVNCECQNLLYYISGNKLRSHFEEFLDHSKLDSL